MTFDGPRRDLAFQCDFLGGFAEGDELQDLKFAACQFSEMVVPAKFSGALNRARRHSMVTMNWNRHWRIGAASIGIDDQGACLDTFALGGMEARRGIVEGGVRREARNA